jgi:hypothetical protein
MVGHPIPASEQDLLLWHYTKGPIINKNIQFPTPFQISGKVPSS